MKHFSILCLMLLVMAGSAFAQTGRYKFPIFDNVNNTTYIPYSRATPQGSSEANTLYLDFYEPKGDTLAQRPLVITVFGGAFVTGSRDFVDMKEYCTRLAKHGYTAASIDYRLLSIGHLSASGLVRTGYMAAQDVSSAVRYFKAHSEEYRIDTSAIFLLGNSAGSIATLHEVFMDDDERPYETYNEPNLGGLHSSGYEEYAHHSPSVAGIISQWGGVADLDIFDSDETTPICLIHGTDDTTVPYDSGYCYTSLLSFLMPYMYGSHPISERLESLHHPDFELHTFEGEKHAFYMTITYQLDEPKFDSCFYIVRDFLLKHLPGTCETTDYAENNSVYPNPATDTLFIQGPIDEEPQVALYDLSGKRWEATTSATSDGLLVDVSKLPKGLYFVVLLKEGKISATKFEKQ